MLSVTESARDALQAFLDEQENPELFFRLRAEGSGCDGYSYSFQIDDLGRKSDLVHHFGNLELRTDEHSALLLDGALIDYDTDPYGMGLHILSARGLSGGCSVSGCGSGG